MRLDQPEGDSAIQLLRDWYYELESLLNQHYESHSISQIRESASIDFDATSHSYRLTVWNYNFALELQHIDLASGESSFPISEERMSIGEFLRTLDEVKQRIQSEQTDA